MAGRPGDKYDPVNFHLDAEDVNRNYLMNTMIDKYAAKHKLQVPEIQHSPEASSVIRMSRDENDNGDLESEGTFQATLEYLIQKLRKEGEPTQPKDKS